MILSLCMLGPWQITKSPTVLVVAGWTKKHKVGIDALKSIGDSEAKIRQALGSAEFDSVWSMLNGRKPSATTSASAPARGGFVPPSSQGSLSGPSQQQAGQPQSFQQAASAGASTAGNLKRTADDIHAVSEQQHAVKRSRPDNPHPDSAWYH